MNRIFFLLFVLGPLTISFAGCVSQSQVNMQRALFAQEYRQLEDELFQAYQNMARLERSNAVLRSQLGQENEENRDRSFNHPGQRLQDPPGIAPISTEGLSPSDELPGILRSPLSSRQQVRPLPQLMEQAQYIEPEFSARPRRPAGNTTAELPVWRPNR